MATTTRRHFLIGAGAATVAAGVVAVRPGVHGAPHQAYFAHLNKVLKDAGIGTPTLVLDLDRVRANAQRISAHIGGRMALRLVNKSLPCLLLLDELSKQCGTNRQMVFSLPYLQLLTKERPHVNVLLGKPLPVAAAAAYYRERTANGFEPARQLQWLIDTPERLAQYRNLAHELRTPIQVNIEIDVGLHRGGVNSDDTLRHMAQQIKEEPLLRWAGLMGYDAHTEKVPALAGNRQRARDHAKARYKESLDVMLGSGLMIPIEPLTFNTGGSPTYRLHDGTGAANELAVGSAVVKPSDFDTPLLDDLLPAAFIATPVIKASDHFTAPYGAEWASQALQWWDPNQRASVFTYGGNWLAQPVSPEGLSNSGLIGKSSNQQILVGSGLQGLQPDDFVFFRPTQSEAVLQQFGDIAVLEQGRLSTRWPAFPAMA
ncbi:MAG: alanine racemase [Aquabacterium sp.]|uniref:alanine racemase n=1 Tax=Aquabacterium sp. TaxID=1872578 RepID=UPI003BC25B56